MSTRSILPNDQNGGGKPASPNILLLTTSLLVDRMFLYSDFLTRLGENSRVIVWSSSFANPSNKPTWSKTAVEVQEFPLIKPFPLHYNYLRRLSEFAWEHAQKPTSRNSMVRHNKHFNRPDINALRHSARLLATLNLNATLENRLESILASYNRSEEAARRLEQAKPDVILTTGPFQFEQPAIVALAKKRKIPVLTLIPSWDNLSTKNRMVFKYDGYLVWSETLREHLHRFYQYTVGAPVYVVGAAQFDVFFQPAFEQTRREFCHEQNLDPDLPIIVYALGSPNFLKEHHGALHLAERIGRGELGAVQMLVRPHPLFDKGELNAAFERFAPVVRVQQTIRSHNERTLRSQDETQISQWVNTFRHADVVVNLSSTVTVDAAIFDRPVVNLDFDPQPGAADQNLIRDINHVWTHFKPVAESGGVWLVNDFDELVCAVKTYLQQPELHRAGRRWIAQHVCEFLDGRNGERMANAVLDFVARQRAKLTTELN